jgi:regulator of sigma E protease
MLYNILISIIAFLVAISILVGIHEYGHFIVARLCGVKVVEFSLGFGPALWKRQSKKGTQYQLALIPIGGYVKMLDERDGPIPLALQPHAFNRQPIWKRCLVILAGPFFNLILAFIAYWLIFMIGFTQIVPKIGDITPNSIAARAGLASGQIITQIDQQKIYSWLDIQTALVGYVGQQQPVSIVVKTENGQLQTHLMHLQDWNIKGLEPDILNSIGITPYMPELPPVITNVLAEGPAAKGGMQANDEVIAINGKPTHDWQAIYDFVQQHPNQTATFTVLRHAKSIDLTFQIGSQEQDGQLVGQLGVMSSLIAWPPELMTMVRYNPWQALVPAWHKVIDITTTSVKLIGKLITGHISLQGISGPIGIAQGAGISASLGVVSFLSFLALISISLGVINLVPIPLLDGGQLVICLLEGLLRRPLPEKVQVRGIQISIFFLLGVMTLALYNDIMRIHH